MSNILTRRFTDGSTTEGLTTIATTRYCDIVAGFSIGFWFYRRATPAGNRTIFNTTGTGIGWNLTLRTTNLLRLQSNLTVVKSRDQNTAVPLNTWVYIVARDTSMGTTGTTDMDFVVNGTVDTGTENGAGSGTKTTGTPTVLLIANSGQAPPGDLGPVAIWTRKIGDNEAIQLSQGASPLDFAQGLVGFWELGGRRGSAFEPDLSGFGLPMFSRSTGVQTWGPPVPRIKPRFSPSFGIASSTPVVVPVVGSFAAINPVPRRPGPGGLTGGIPTEQSKSGALGYVAPTPATPGPFRMSIPMRQGPGGFGRGVYTQGATSSPPTPPIPPAPGTNLWFPDDKADFF